MVKTVAVAIIATMLAVGIGTAYAQTNTEKITSLVESAQEHTGLLEDIQQALTGMIESLSAITDMITGLVDSVAGANTKLDGISTQITDVQESISGTDQMIMDMRDSITDDVDEIHSALADPDGANIASLADGINTNSDYLIDIIIRLNSMEDRLEELEQTGTRKSGNTYRSGDIERLYQSGDLDGITITAYNYKRAGGDEDGGNTRYDLDIDFSCNTDVYLDTASAKIRSGQEPNVWLGINSDNVNYIHIEDEGAYLINSKFGIGNGRYVEYQRDFDFRSLRLSAGDVLTFETRMWDVDDGQGVYLIANSTRGERVDIYDISLDWLSYTTDTVCRWTVPGGSKTIEFGSEQNLIYSVNMSNEKTLLREYSDVISCDGSPVIIERIRTGIPDEFPPTLADFATLTVHVLDDRNEDKPDAIYEFDTDGSIHLVEGKLPQTHHDILIKGSIPVIENMLLSVQYTTIDRAECEVED